MAYFSHHSCHIIIFESLLEVSKCIIRIHVVHMHVKSYKAEIEKHDFTTLSKMNHCKGWYSNKTKK